MTDRLAEIRRLAEAATPGPWVVSDYMDDGGRGIIAADGEAGGHGGTIVVRYHVRGKWREEDFAFLAAAREAVPWLLAKVERLAAEPRWDGSTHAHYRATLAERDAAAAALTEAGYLHLTLAGQVAAVLAEVERLADLAADEAYRAERNEARAERNERLRAAITERVHEYDRALAVETNDDALAGHGVDLAADMRRLALPHHLPADGPDRTHWADCWRAHGHHACAIARAERLEMERDERAREDAACWAAAPERDPCPDCGAEWSFTTVPAMGWLLRHADDCPAMYPTPWQNAGFSGRIRMWGNGAAATVGPAGWVAYGLDGETRASGAETGADGERMADLALLEAAIRAECERVGLGVLGPWTQEPEGYRGVGGWWRMWGPSDEAANVGWPEGTGWQVWSRPDPLHADSDIVAEGAETPADGRLAADRALLAWLRTQPDGGGA